MRKFKKISKKQFKKDIPDGNYDDIVLPFRKTMNSAGYDFISLNRMCIKPNESVKIPTGIKAMLNSDEFLAIYIRSSLGIKYGIRLSNQVGIVDADYYNNPDNEGHIWICVKNEGENDFVIEKGTAFAQGVFTKYYITDDDNASGVRTGGIGSTDRR